MTHHGLAHVGHASWARALDLDDSGAGWSDSPVYVPNKNGASPTLNGAASQDAALASADTALADGTRSGHRRRSSADGDVPDVPQRVGLYGTASPVMMPLTGTVPPPLLALESAAGARGAGAAPTLAASPGAKDELSALAAELSRLVQLGTDATANDAAEQRDALREISARMETLSRRARMQPPSPARWFGSVPPDGSSRDAMQAAAGCEVLVARSWEELNSFLFLDSWDERIGKHRLRHVFRGSGNASAHTLRTSIQRLGDLAHIRTVEPAMIRAFRRYAAACVAGGAVAASTGAGGAALGRDASVWEWLTVAQHHGLPTRLLDWTHNPMIAAHFVTDRPEDLCADGAIWCVDPAALNSRSEEFRRWNLGRPQGAKVLGVFAIEQLEEYCHDNAPAHAKPGSRISSLEMFDATQLRCAFLEPPSIDARLVHQSGLFSALSPDCDMDALLTASPSCARKIIIPAWLKREVRDKLDAIGVSERTLFPGLDGLCTWLRRYYTKGTREHPRAPLQQVATASRARTAEDGGSFSDGPHMMHVPSSARVSHGHVHPMRPDTAGEAATTPINVGKPTAQRPLNMLSAEGGAQLHSAAPSERSSFEMDNGGNGHGSVGEERSMYARSSSTTPDASHAWGDGL